VNNMPDNVSPGNRDDLLAAWACRDTDSGGRLHPEPAHPYRSDFQRDRDRIMHCSAFRRLDFKTQVFVPHEHDHFRTRLTHTLEVAQIGRALGRALGLNEDLIEAAALAHDLGHPPFGHCGEAVLDELMVDAGGFEHNRQSLRVVDYLEHPYPTFRGLNLTRAVRECLARHETRYDQPVSEEFDLSLRGPLEGQLTDLADEIAYTSADLEDALATGWIGTDDLTPLTLWQRAWDQAKASAPDARNIHTRIRAVKTILAIMADDVVYRTPDRLAAAGISSLAEVRRADRLIAFSPALAEEINHLQAFLMERVYCHPANRAHQEESTGKLRALFEHFLSHPDTLPSRYGRRIDSDGLHRVVCDYLAGMTDRFCHQQFNLLIG
jgi:dGTPase